ncbi:MAG: MFS transporter, partial [Armatimonadetes bacterium]|nr:MFS transporter [Armatimonadota bacterium]
ALYVPTALALLAEHHSTGTRAKAMAGHFSGLHAGMLAGGTFAGYAGDYYGWRSCFLILGGAGLLLAGLCWFTVYQNVPPAAGQAASSPPPRQSLGDALAGVLRIPSFLVLCLDSFLTSMSTWVFMNWLPLYYRETFGLSLTAAGFSGTFTLVAGTMAGVLAGGYISDRVARRAAKYRMLMQAAGHLAGAPLLLVFASPAGLPVVVAAGVLFFVFRGSSQANGHPMVCELVGAERWGTGLGTVIMVASVSGGVGVQLSGYLKSSFGLASIFAGASLMVLLNGVILIGGYLLFLERDLKRRAALAGAAQ